MSQIHHLPLTPGFFAILVGIFVIVLILRSVRYAYESLGVSSGAAMFLLFATLVGSIFNIPVAELPPERIVSHEVFHFFGMRYRVPVVTHWAGTVIAVNVGGAVIPTLMSVYLLIKRDLWVKGLIATAVVALVIHWMADPVPGLGIAVPVFMPALVTAAVALLVVAQGCPAAGLYRRRPWHPDWCRLDQSRQGARPRRARRLDRRRRNVLSSRCCLRAFTCHALHIKHRSRAKPYNTFTEVGAAP
jgi:uncharacterized membrane protein